MAPSSPNVSAPSRASTLPTTQTTSATPRSLPDWRSTAPGTVKMPEPIVVPTTMRTRSRSVRTRASSRALPATSELAGNRFRHLNGRGLPADIGRPHAGGERVCHRALQIPGRLGMAQLLEHQRAREHGRHRVRHALAGERRRRAVHRLEQAGAPGVEVGARREPQSTYEPRAEVRQYVAVEIVADDDLEPLGLAHQLHRQGVHVAMLGVDPRKLGGDALERFLPDPMRGHGVRLVAHRDASLAVRLRPLERRADDTLHGFAGVYFLGDVLVALDSAPTEIDAFSILAEDDEVDRALPLERCQVRVEQADRPEIDVQIEPEPQPKQNDAGVLVAGDAGVSDRPQ